MSDNITDEYIDGLLKDWANPKKAQPYCFIFDELVFEYAEKSVLGESALSPYLEGKILEHIDGCPHCFYNYLEAQQILREKIPEKDLLLIKSMLSKNKIGADENSFLAQPKWLVIKLREVGKRICIDDLALFAPPTQEFLAVRSGVSTEEALHSYLVPGDTVEIRVDERWFIFNSELLKNAFITVMHQAPSGELMEIGRWIVGPENEEVLHWRAPELPGEHMIEIYITRDEPPTTGTDIKKFQEWIESREDNDKVSFKKAVQVRFC